MNDYEQEKAGGKTINVLVVEPGLLPYKKEICDSQDMRKLIGTHGYRGKIYEFKKNVAVVYNEYGKDEKLEFNRSIPERGFGGVFGTFVVCGLSEGRFTSLTPEQITTYAKRFRKAEVLLDMYGNKPVTIKIAAAPKYPPNKPKPARKPPAR